MRLIGTVNIASLSRRFALKESKEQSGSEKPWVERERWMTMAHGEWRGCAVMEGARGAWGELGAQIPLEQTQMQRCREWADVCSSPMIASIFSVKQEAKLSFDSEDKASGLEV